MYDIMHLLVLELRNRHGYNIKCCHAHAPVGFKLDSIIYWEIDIKPFSPNSGLQFSVYKDTVYELHQRNIQYN